MRPLPEEVLVVLLARAGPLARVLSSWSISWALPGRTRNATWAADRLVWVPWFPVVGVLGTGVPRLACLRPAAWLKGGPSTAHLHQHKLKTLARGQASRGGRQGASSGTASSGWLMRRRRVQGGVPREVPMTQAMTTKGASRAPARAVSSFPLWCKGSKRRREHQAKASISVQQDQDQ